MWKVKNKTKECRKFREHKNAILHFLRSGEEVIISNKPATDRVDVFEITDLNKFEEDLEKSTVPKDLEEQSIKKRKK